MKISIWVIFCLLINWRWSFYPKPNRLWRYNRYIYLNKCRPLQLRKYLCLCLFFWTDNKNSCPLQPQTPRWLRLLNTYSVLFNTIYQRDIIKFGTPYSNWNILKLFITDIFYYKLKDKTLYSYILWLNPYSSNVIRE